MESRVPEALLPCPVGYMPTKEFFGAYDIPRVRIMATVNSRG